MLATYQHEVQRLVVAAGSLLQEQAPIDALRSWVERLARYAVTKHGLADALRKATTPGSDLSSTDTYGAIVAALDRLLQANVSAGTLRPGLDADDVILALAGLWQLDRQATGELKHSASTTSSSAAYSGPPKPKTRFRAVTSNSETQAPAPQSAG